MPPYLRRAVTTGRKRVRRGSESDSKLTTYKEVPGRKGVGEKTLKGAREGGSQSVQNQELRKGLSRKQRYKWIGNGRLEI